MSKKVQAIIANYETKLLNCFLLKVKNKQSKKMLAIYGLKKKEESLSLVNILFVFC